jgi:signal peptidase II
MTTIKKLHWILIALLVFAIDRISKIFVLTHLSLETPVEIFPFFNLFLTYNTGAAFSFLNKAGGWQKWLFSIIAVGISIYIVVWQFKIDIKNFWLKTSLSLILGGTLGNLYDRIVYHHVIDFLDFHYLDWHYPVFNLADSAICTGAIMLIIDIVRNRK